MGYRISQLASDSEKELDGVWVEVELGLQIKVARIGNPKYKACLRKLSKPHLRKMRRGNISTELAEEITRKAIVETIILDWKNLEDDDGKAIKFSKEGAKKLFEEYPEFYDMVAESAGDVELFKMEEIEESAKN